MAWFTCGATGVSSRYNASHSCIRVPLFAAKELSSLMRSKHQCSFTTRVELLTVIKTFAASAMLMLIFDVTCLGQEDDNKFRNQLSLKAAFTTEDFSALDQGRRVVKLLPVVDKREVAICGVVPLHGSPPEIAKTFQHTMAQLNAKSLLASGRFRDPPSLADVETLTLENRDIEDLRECVVGDCKLKLSAGMIGRFQTEVDWNGADYRVQATSVFRKMLVEYVRDYLARGTLALIAYSDQDPTVQVYDEQKSLLQSLVYINDFAPEFAAYLRDFPSTKRADVHDVVTWTKIKFGLKPVIFITHVATYQPATDGPRKVLIVSRQIYANHYFDSSLTLSVALHLPTTDDSLKGYLLYANHTRADALDGSFSKLKRSIARTEAERSLTTLLDQTRVNIEVNAINKSQPKQTSNQQRIVEFLFGGRRLLLWLVGILLVSLLIKSRVNFRFIRA